MKNHDKRNQLDPLSDEELAHVVREAWDSSPDSELSPPQLAALDAELHSTIAARQRRRVWVGAPIVAFGSALGVALGVALVPPSEPTEPDYVASLSTAHETWDTLMVTADADTDADDGQLDVMAWLEAPTPRDDLTHLWTGDYHALASWLGDATSAPSAETTLDTRPDSPTSNPAQHPTQPESQP